MEMKNIIKSLLESQKEMGNAIKDSANPFFKKKYADLNAVREACIPILNSNGIVAMQPMVNVDGKNYIKTVLLHTSGEYIESFTEIIYSKQNDAQSQGSGITYARRYGLQSLVNIGAEDDDGNIASKTTPSPKQTPAQRLEACTTLDQLKATFDSLTGAEKTANEACKNKMKTKLITNK